jgi:DNA ligase-1
VRQGFARLLGIARESGSGSIQRKIDLLAELLRNLDALEARYVVRAAQGRLRLGVGEQTILEATALSALGDLSAKPVLERAFNVRSDIGGVVAVAFHGGRRALARITPRVGVPVRPALAQRLPSAAAIVERLGTVQAEPKYDGFRLQLHRDGNEVRAFSRRLENVTEMFPELTAALRRELRARRVILEGEAVVQNPKTGAFLPFQETITRKRKTALAKSTARHPLRLFAFDLLYAGGRSYLDRPQRERTARLRTLLPSSGRAPIVVTEARVVRSSDALESYFDDMLRRGLEGIVAKRPDAPYRAGARGYDWVKLKRSYQSRLRDTVDVVLVGYLRGRGKRAGPGIGSLLGAVYDPAHDRFRTVAKIGSGLSDAAWKALRRRLDGAARDTKPARVDSHLVPDVWVEPRIVVEVLADEITRSPLHTCGRVGGRPGYALRFPRLLTIRADKGPEEATSEREVLELFRLQRAAAKRGSTARASR